MNQVFQPISDRVIIKPEEVSDRTAGGLIKPDIEKMQAKGGEVVAVGPGRTENGIQVPMQLKIGDKVLYPKHAAGTIDVDKETYVIMRELDVLTKITILPTKEA